MFQKLHGAFQSGIDDLALTNSKDHSAIVALTATVQKIPSTWTPSITRRLCRRNPIQP